MERPNHNARIMRETGSPTLHIRSDPAAFISRWIPHATARDGLDPARSGGIRADWVGPAGSTLVVTAALCAEHRVGSGRAATRLQRAPSFRRPPLSRRGEALWEREAAGSCSQGAASGRCGQLRRAVAVDSNCLIRPRIRWCRRAVVHVGALVGWDVVVRFVCVIRVPVLCPCAPVCPFLSRRDTATVLSRLPRCLFTGTRRSRCGGIPATWPCRQTQRRSRAH